MKQLRTMIAILLRMEALLQQERERQLPLSEPGLSSDTEKQQWMDRQAVMDYLKISVRTFYRLRNEGVLVAHRIGGRDYFFKHELLQAFDISRRKGRL